MRSGSQRSCHSIPAPAKEDETDALGQAVYERMQEIGNVLVLTIADRTVQNTFAVRCLLKGMRIEDVSKLLCHSSISVTERFYAPWVQSRKEQLEVPSLMRWWARQFCDAAQQVSGEAHASVAL